MIHVFTTTSEVQAYLSKMNNIGFVPTMGNLHSGHLSLLNESLHQCENSVISIFVNPTQFSKGEDFKNYPRTFQEDLELVKELDAPDRNIIIYSPTDETEIYPNGKDLIRTLIGPCNTLEGSLRPGHFQGMITVVKRLFEIIQPSQAFFGKKDYQQLAIIKELVKEYNFNIEVVGLPIIREQSGLAMSSRNSYLTKEEKEEALILRQTLTNISDKIKSNFTFEDIQKNIKTILADDRFNYLALCHQDTLSEVNDFSKDMVLLGNFQVNQTKLLDNIEIEGIK